jgi:DNA-binding transcriptional ArsR family regulator
VGRRCDTFRASRRLQRGLSKAMFRNMPFEPRDLSDPRAMRALAHPLRLALLEALLHAAAPLTATEAAERVGESPSSCSFHLRQLAKYGFVEEAGAAAGRRRPWRLTSIGLRFHSGADTDPEARLAYDALDRVLRDRYLGRAQEALDRRAALPAEWREVTGINQFLLYVTAEELAELDRELVALLTRHHDRLTDPASRPAGAQPVELLSLAYPVDPPQAGG